MLLRLLTGAKKRKGAFADRNQLMSVIAKTGEHERRGDRDDVVRFLLNEGIVLDHDDGRFYFDVQRAETILDCVAHHLPTPSPRSDKEALIAAIIAANERSSVDASEEALAEGRLAETVPDVDAPPPTLEEQAAALRQQIAALRTRLGR